MGLTAAEHGKALLHQGYSVNQVVHDCGNLCQAVKSLAFERDAPFSIGEYRTLNRCLDNAIADAVTEFSAQRDEVITAQQGLHENEQLGFLMHELRNSLSTATLAPAALELGGMPVTGATGAVLKRSHASMARLICHSLAEVATKGGDAEEQQMLSLEAYAVGERILIDVKDHCSGLPPGNAEKLFAPFSQRSDDKTGLGLGLTIARKSVEADGGILSVRKMPGTGCIFTIDLPRYSLS